jgi:hypothetical protein
MEVLNGDTIPSVITGQAKINKFTMRISGTVELVAMIATWWIFTFLLRKPTVLVVY